MQGIDAYLALALSRHCGTVSGCPAERMGGVFASPPFSLHQTWRQCFVSVSPQANSSAYELLAIGSPRRECDILDRRVARVDDPAAAARSRTPRRRRAWLHRPGRLTCS